MSQAKQHILYIVFIFNCIPIFSTAQVSNLSFTNYTTTNGLCCNRVNDILQDSRSFMWFATAEGLSRFDGTNFKNFYAGINGSNAFFDNFINSLCEYQKGRLVFVSGQVWEMNTITQQFYQLRQFDGKAIVSFQKSSCGKYFFTATDTCYVSNGTLQLTDTLVPPTRNKHNWIYAMELDTNTLLVTNGIEIFFYSMNTKSYRPLQISTELINETNGIYLRYYNAKHKCLYLSKYYDGLYAFSLTGQLLHHWPPGPTNTDISSSPVLSVIPKNDSLLLVGTAGGFNILNTRTSTVTHILKHENDAATLVSNDIQSLYTDGNKNTWVATTGGISKLNHTAAYITSWHQQFDSVDAKGGLQTITKGPDSNMYVSFYFSHTYRVNNKDGIATRLTNKGIPGAWSLHADGNNLIITGGGGTTIMQYNTVTGAYKKSNFLKPYFPQSDIVVTGFKHSNGDDWYSGNGGGGFIRTEATTGIIHSYKKDGDRGKFSISYYPFHTETANGDLWFGVNKLSVLLHWNKATDYFDEINFDTVPGTQGVHFYGMNCLTHDKENNIWMGFNGSGLVKYNSVTHTAAHYTMQEGLPTNRVSSVQFDAKNRLWIGTAKGISCFITGTQKFVNFNKEDGLPADFSEEGCSYFDTLTNRLWIGTGNTLMRFNPDSLLATADKPFSVYMDEIFVNGKRIRCHHLQQLELKPDENNLQFQFIAVDIDNGKDMEYSYRMMGADKEWINNGSITSASYANLAPGNYTFNVRAKHKGDNVWTEMKSPFSCHIQTPWNRSWWFMLMLISASGFLIWIIFRAYYLRKLENQRAVIEKQSAISKERSRIAADMHDDMGVGLSRMRYLSIALKNEIPDERKKSELDKLITGSDELVDKMNEIIWTLNNNDGHLEELLYYIRSQCSEMLDGANMEFEYQLPPVIPSKPVSSEQKRNLYLVVKEAVHNAIKHSKATCVHLDIAIENELKISVADNGTGFSGGQIKSGGNGLGNYQKRMSALGGTVTIQSDKNGTTVIFQTPIV